MVITAKGKQEWCPYKPELRCQKEDCAYCQVWHDVRASIYARTTSEMLDEVIKIIRKRGG